MDENIINLESCRFCNQGFPDENEKCSIDTNFQQTFYTLTGLKFNADQKLPAYSCKVCLEAIKRSAELKISVIKNEERLAQLLDTVISVEHIKTEVEDSLFFNEDDYDAKDFLQIKQESSISGDVSTTEKYDEENESDTLPLKTRKSKKKKSTKDMVQCPQCDLVCNQNFIRTHIRRIHDMVRKHKCKECGKGFFKPSELISHSRVHDKNRVSEYDCHVCGRLFKSKEGLKIHVDSKHLNIMHGCDRCEKKFSQIKYLMNHLESAHGIKSEPRKKRLVIKDESVKNPSGQADRAKYYKKFQCDDCGKIVSSSKVLEIHKVSYHLNMDPEKKEQLLCEIDSNRSHSKEKIPCKQCGKILTRSMMRTHILRIHEKIKRFFCDYCGLSFYRKHELESHMKSHMKNREMTEKCEFCDRMFYSRLGLQKHIDRIHFNKELEKPYVCEVCGKAFEHNCNLTDHKKQVHTNERPFECSECGRFYISNYVLRQHKKNVHSGSVNCIICNKTIRCRKSLMTHMRLVHREKKFECTFEGCTKKFPLEHLLKYHIRVHLEDRNHECTLCQSRYFNGGDLRSHIQNVHMKFKLQCEVQGCHSQFARKDHYKTHVLQTHSYIVGDHLKVLLERIEHAKMPTKEEIEAFANIRNYDEEPSTSKV